MYSRDLPAYELSIENKIREGQHLQKAGLQKEAEKYFCSASEEISQHYYDGIVSFLKHVFDDEYGYAEGVAYDVLRSISRALPSFRLESSIRTWLFAIARNKFRDELRKHYHRSHEEDIENFTESLIDPKPSPDKRYEDKEFIQYCINNLDRFDKEIVLLSCLEGFSSMEIAGILDTTPSNVRVRLMRALKRLRRIFETEK